MQQITTSSEPTSAIKMQKGKRSISRANEPKIINNAAAIYQTAQQGPTQDQRRQSNNQTKNKQVVNRKVVSKTIEIDGELETLQVQMMSP